MGNELDEKLEGLLDKYTELLLGETNEELKKRCLAVDHLFSYCQKHAAFSQAF